LAYKVFPSNLVKLDWKSTKKQSWNTTVQKSGSGKIRTMCNQSLPSWTIETKFNMLTDADYRQLLGFVASVKGGFEPFLWLDPEDYKEDDVTLTSIGGVFQGIMRMGEWQEDAIAIKDLLVIHNHEQIPGERIRIDGGAFYIVDEISGDPITEEMTITAYYKYYWLVRFADDAMSIERIFYGINKSKSFKLEVVRP